MVPPVNSIKKIMCEQKIYQIINNEGNELLIRLRWTQLIVL